jgi:hypothetical protein
LVLPAWLLKAMHGAEDVDHRRALVRQRGADQRHQLLLVAGEAARDEGRAHAAPG